MSIRRPVVLFLPARDRSQPWPGWSSGAPPRCSATNAQVLTFDLLAKGNRYLEVPITYRFRTTGQSFVELVPYLRQAVPALRAELRGEVREPDLSPTVT